MNDVFLIYGDNLFPLEYFEKFKDKNFLMIEGPNLNTHFKYHKMRLAFLQSASRHKYKELEMNGYNVQRILLHDDSLDSSYCERLKKYCTLKQIKKIHTYGKEDKFFHLEVSSFCAKSNIEYIVYKTPLFLNTHEDFKDYLTKYKIHR